MDLECLDLSVCKEALSNYPARIISLNKPNLVSLDDFYRNQLPSLLHQRNPNPHITTSELSKLMQWKLTRGKWRFHLFILHFSPLLSSLYFHLSYCLTYAANFRPRLLDFVSSLDESLVKSASQKAFQSLPDISKAVSELTVLKGVGPATASAVLAAFAPHLTPFMSDEVTLLSFTLTFTSLIPSASFFDFLNFLLQAMEAALGNSKDYSLKQYLRFANKLQTKAKVFIRLRM